MRCLFFGCWNGPGHFVFDTNGQNARPYGIGEYYGDRIHLDGTLAPRKSRRDGLLCWAGQGETPDRRNSITYNSDEHPQGQFLRHVLDSGFTAIQWWDRQQGDSRGACNSTLLLEGAHSTEEMLAALHLHFPHVVANLTKGGVALVEVVAPAAPSP